jgi:hypothetical protein
MSNSTTHAPSGLSVRSATLEGGRIVHADADADLANDILESRTIVILRSVFPKALMVELRRGIIAWGEATAEIERGVSASKPGINFHRRDDGTMPSSLQHIFHQYGFGDWENLPDVAQKLLPVCEAALELQNRLAGTDFALRTDMWRLKAMRHPRGGGYLQTHTHPFLPQKVSVFINLSEPGVDYHSGAARFRSKTGRVDTHEEFQMGDVLAWRYDLLHDVSPVDGGQPLTWDGDDGLWIAAVEGADVHPKSKASAGS